MAEIYNFLNNKQKIEAKEKENRKGEKPNFKDKIDYGKLTELRCLVDELISKTTGNPQREAYLTKYNFICTYSDAEIIGWINNFNEKEVTTDQFFYSALIEVAKERELIRPHF